MEFAVSLSLYFCMMLLLYMEVVNARCGGMLFHHQTDVEGRTCFIFATSGGEAGWEEIFGFFIIKFHRAAECSRQSDRAGQSSSALLPDA